MTDTIRFRPDPIALHHPAPGGARSLGQVPR